MAVNDGWEDVTDPAEMKQVLGVEGANRLMTGNAGRPLPAWAARPYEEQIGVYAGLANSARSFQDDFAGNTLTGGLENSLQGVFGTGTPGQRDWWAQFRQNDNVIRNQLFGATLTPSEQRAYADTSINERMTPEQVRLNLKSRQDAVRKALARRTAFLRSQGYSSEAIDALAGEFAPDFNPALAPPVDVPGAGAGPLVGRFNDEMPAEPLRQLKPEDRAAYWELERTAKTPGELVGFMADRGFAMDPERAKAIIDARNRGASLDDREIVTELPKPLDIGDGATGAFARGIGDTATLGSLDELGGAIDTAGDIWSEGLQGRSLRDTLYANIDRNRAILAGDAENHPIARFGGQIVGGAILPSGMFGAGRPAAMAAMRAGLGREAAQAAAGRAIALRGGLEGAGYGTAYGFGSAEGNPIERAPSALRSGVGGAALGYGLSRAGSAYLARRLRGPSGPTGGGGGLPQAAEDVARGEAFGIDVPWGATGSRAGAIVDNTLSNLPGSASIMNRARQRLAQQVDDARNAASSSYGAGTDLADVGEAAQAGARKWMGRFEDVSDKVYDAIPIQANRSARVLNTRQALTKLVDVFPTNEKLAAIFSNQTLRRYLDAFTREASPVMGGYEGVTPRYQTATSVSGGTIGWNDLKHFRSIIGNQIGELRFGDSPMKDELRAVYAALSEDMRDTAAAAGPKALRAFDRANDIYARGQMRIENALVDILGDNGNRPVEAAGALIQRISKSGKSSSDIRKLSAIRASMPAHEWGEVAGSLIQLLGQAGNSEGRQFNAQTFIRNYDDMAPEAKRLIFADRGRGELMKNLDEFARVVRGLADVDALRNTSNTAGQVLTGSTLGALAGMNGLTGMAGGLATLAMSYGGARLVTNPGFVKWATGLAKLERMGAKPSGINAQIQRLSAVAAREPAIAQAIGQLQVRLIRAANDNVNLGRAAASERPGENEQDRR